MALKNVNSAIQVTLIPICPNNSGVEKMPKAYISIFERVLAAPAESGGFEWVFERTAFFSSASPFFFELVVPFHRDSRVWNVHNQVLGIGF